MLNALVLSKLKLAGLVFVGIALTGTSTSKFLWPGQNHAQPTLTAALTGEQVKGKKGLGLVPFDKGRLAKNLREGIPALGRPDHEERERRGTMEDSSEPSRDDSMDEGKKRKRGPEPQFDRAEGRR